MAWPLRSTPRPLTRSTRPLGVPGGSLTFTVAPSSVGTSKVLPRAASSKVTGTVTVRLSPSRPKTGCGVDLDADHHVAGRRPLVPRVSLAGQADSLSVPHPGRDPDGDRPTLLGAQLHGLAVDGLAEADRRRRVDVGAALGSARRAVPAVGGARTRTEHAAEQVLEGCATGAARLAAGAEPHPRATGGSRTPAGASEHGAEDVLELAATTRAPAPEVNRAPPDVIERIASYCWRCSGSESTE